MRAKLNPIVRVTGTGSYVPEGLVDNPTLSELVHGYDAERSGDFGRWVDQVTHIHERRFSKPGVRSSDLALIAAQRALESAGIAPTDLGMICYATFTPSEMIPGDHCLLAHQLGAVNTPSVWLMGACAGSLYGMASAWSMIASGLYEHVLVIGTETASKALNFHDPMTSIIFGDGAGAVVLSRDDSATEGGMLPPYLNFEYSARNIHVANSNIPIDVAQFPDKELQPGVPLVEQALVEMEGGPSVLRRAVKNMSKCTARCLGYDVADLKAKTPELFETLSKARIVPHQANGRILDGLTKDLRTSADRVTRTIYRFGNISAASNLIALDFGLRNGNLARELDDEGLVTKIVEQPEHRFETGDLVLLPSIGGGYLMGCAGFIVDEALTKQTPIPENATPFVGHVQV